MHVEIASAVSAEQHRDQLNDLMIDSVNTGASIGWIMPMPRAEADAYWRARIAEVEAGSRVLLLAWIDDALVGSAQLGLEQRPNGTHRAEVQKLLVHSAYRRRGIARQLLTTLEACARAAQRSLLFLDTRQGDVAEHLYQAFGYQRVGAIPNYVTNEHGEFEATVVYYKLLTCR